MVILIKYMKDCQMEDGELVCAIFESTDLKLKRIHSWVRDLRLK